MTKQKQPRPKATDCEVPRVKYCNDVEMFIAAIEAEGACAGWFVDRRTQADRLVS